MDAGKRLYPTAREEREYRKLKDRYGFKDAVVVRGDTAKVGPVPKKSKKKKK